MHAVDPSRHSGLWSAMMKIVTAVADSTFTATVHAGVPDAPHVLAELEPSTYRPDAFLAGPILIKLERTVVPDRLPRALAYARARAETRRRQHK
ncbi:hypothetical protein ACJ5H2_22285 (plasmid) [Nocardioides sp. R1-1]|uniref:hypothetical protein n=1 Tax=Nocardioides sp. R1-1 TaxID=3383502 RepID=UPI0038D04946